MNLARLDLNLLLVFDAVFVSRSVTVAAQRLGIRQPAVSAALGKLRADLEDELFVRAAGAMQPTAKALRIAPDVAEALAILSTTLSGATAFDPATSERCFTVASTDYTTMVLLPGLLKALEVEAPKVSVRVFGYDKDDISGLIDRAEIDLALGVFRNAPERAIRKRLCNERFIGICRDGHPLLHSGKMTLQNYAQARHALVTVKRDTVGEIDAILQAKGMRRRITVVMPHMLALPGVLAATDLVAALPERAAQMMAKGSLRLFELPLRQEPWRIEMLWNAGMRSDPAGIWLRSKIFKIASCV